MMKPSPDFLILLNDFNEMLRACRRVYVDSAQTVVDHYPHLLEMSPKEFIETMDDLHRGLLIKLFVTIGNADRTWTVTEEHLAGVLFYHLWHKRMSKSQIRDSIRHLEAQSNQIQWTSLVKPFAEFEPLRYSIPELETSIIRIANLIAKVDGSATSIEMEELKSIQKEILGFLHRKQPAKKKTTSDGGAYQIDIEVEELTLGVDDEEGLEILDDSVDVAARPSLEESLARLDEMIGLDEVKQEVRTLINFLKVQKSRRVMGLPETPISLHMVFAGNPGTGKTTVARILGDIYSAMGILDKGHLVETDRAGLVAEYAGQTAPKTDKVIDQAMDGVLFIDEAYSLVAAESDDPYGNEAMQKLLKRMEDDRKRLIVILAGYPQEMERLLKSNPGLSSRFNHDVGFEDFEPRQLCQIFEQMAEANEYKISGLARSKLQYGLSWLQERRDEHFGNGRLVRNLFELAIRRLANRIVDSPKLTRGLLTRFEHSDVYFEDVPDNVVNESVLQATRYSFVCPACEKGIVLESKLLGRKVQCKKCDHRFRIGWCDAVTD